MASEREKYLAERDKFQEEQDSNRVWHRPQEHTFKVHAPSGEGEVGVDPIVGGSAAGSVFIDTQGEKRLDQVGVATLIGELQAAFQAVS